MITSQLHKHVRAPACQRAGGARRLPRCFATTGEAASLEASVEVLKAACKSTVPRSEVYESIRAVYKGETSGLEWSKIVSPGAKWRWAFVADSKYFNKGDETRATGAYYAPVLAGYAFESGGDGEGTEGSFVQTVQLPFLAGMQFKGPYKVDGKKLSFCFTSISLRIGPFTLGPFDVNLGMENGVMKPFFMLRYVDEDIALVIGRMGGVALWSRVSPTQALELGLEL